MRIFGKGVLAALAVTAGLSTVLTPAIGQETPVAQGEAETAEAPAAKPIDPAEIKTFSGAYLAARTAEIDQDYESATRYYQRALRLDPGNKEVERSLFLGLLATGDFTNAVRYAEQLKLVREVSQLSTLTLGIDAMRKKEFTKAAGLFSAETPSDLDRLVTGLLAAWARQGAGDSKGARETLDALEGPPWYAIFVGYHTALISEAAGNKAEAQKAYATVLENQEAGGAAPDTWLRAAEAYARFMARDNKRDEALTVLDTADTFVTGRVQLQSLREDIRDGRPVEKLVPNSTAGAAESLLNLGTALNQSGGENVVRLYLQLSRALYPANDMTLLQLASVAEQQQQAEQAIALYAKIPARSPLKRVAELQIGLNLADLKRNDEAIEHLKLALAEDGEDMRAYLALGGVYSGTEKFREAADIYDEAVAKLAAPARANWNIFYQRGIAYERLKEWDKAEPNFRKALELYPDQPQVLNYLGYSLVDMNRNLEEGLAMIQKAVELRPSDGYIVDSLGWAHYRMGKYDDAVRELERAVSLKPDDPVLNDHLGDAYWRVGRKLEATFQWSHAIDRKPDPAELEKIREKLASGLQDEEAPRATDASPAVPPAPPAAAGDPEKI